MAAITARAEILRPGRRRDASRSWSAPTSTGADASGPAESRRSRVRLGFGCR